MAECLSLGFDKKSRKAVVQNKFISSGSEAYSWNSSNGPVVNNPMDLDNLPVIKSVMSKINSEFGCELNCTLVSFYKDGEVNARLHRDDEEELDQTQPIVVISLGTVRSVEFVDNKQESFRSNALSLSPAEGSVYIMRAGCQQRFRHRVRMNKRAKGFRISLSFRAFLPQPRPVSTPCSSAYSFTTPDSKFADNSVTSNKQVLDTPVAPRSAPAVETLFKQRPSPSIESLRKDSVDAASSPIPSGYSPFPSHLMNSSKSMLPNSDHKSAEKLCLLFGTSITEHVDEKMMSKGNRVVVNISSSGATIENINKMASDFHYENPQSVHKVDKIVLSVGTNDVKWYNCFAKDMRRDLKPKLVKLVQDLKHLYPSAHISFQTVLPIRVVYKYTAASIHQFNNLLLEVCTQFGCTFFDCFARFLDCEGTYYSRHLFRDNWHLNNIGLKVLCRALKFLIYGNLYNPLPRYTFYHRFYPN